MSGTLTGAETENLEGKTIGKSHFVIGKYLTGGAFGRIHLGKNTQTGLTVCVKLESQASPKPQLPLEYKFYKILGKGKGIPNIYYIGPVGNWSALVMDLLGPNLENLFEKCEHKFSVRTTVQLAIQLIGVFEIFHGRRLIYRDTKPENFLMGPSGSDTYNQAFICDMGMCKEYKDEKGNHIPEASRKPWTGTLRYMSINNHANNEQSRRDDMEALSYMFVFFMKGELPWQGVDAANIIEKYRAVGDVKRKTTPAVLCSDMPEEFLKFTESVRGLGFTEDPKYKAYINMFTKLLAKMGHDMNEGYYDWDKNHKPRPAKDRK
ncbi:unnamed protein product [Medioppia subpectinata]|uniref:Protein kinase domain-containing protein n=1 Tax=Medioppia subpectinata TaxID=1979941 RepID=A0A7R9LNJ9_9ACAR|nr:unnamed protein product [Medioppia subpectinata]CAG2120347.1 unnamed protein product [Medioppia subpectinata]